DDDAQRAGFCALQFGGSDCGLAARDFALAPVQARLPSARCVGRHTARLSGVPTFGPAAFLTAATAIPWAKRPAPHFAVWNSMIAGRQHRRRFQTAIPIAGVAQFALQAVLADVAGDDDGVRL